MVSFALYKGHATRGSFSCNLQRNKRRIATAKTIAHVTPHFRNLQSNKTLRCKLQEK